LTTGRGINRNKNILVIKYFGIKKAKRFVSATKREWYIIYRSFAASLSYFKIVRY
jgi:hypothetical protein